jgi:lipopolysaccharide/colanic/teichoic acid biosynthesis glycosyltransferase
MRYGLVKRVLDVLVAAVGLAVLAPLLAVIAIAIAVSMGSPVLFTQPRAGKDGRRFVIYKFRTMTRLPPELAEAPWDARRITVLGRWLRGLSVDELPQLWNVLRGEMSLVGPRPLLERYSPWLTERERARLTVPPGITGWAQVNGRANAPWDERLAMDTWYVDNRSLMLDVKILALTALDVVRRKDVHLEPATRLQDDLDVERKARRCGTPG